MSRRTVLAAAALLSVVFVAVGIVLAVSGRGRSSSPTHVVTDYFTALQQGDAAAALGYGDLPDAPRTLLTDAVLGAQQMLAPIVDVRVGESTHNSDRASVPVSYSLRYADETRQVRTIVALHRAGSTWRMDEAAIPTTLHLTQAGERAHILSGRVPTGQVLLFPGALPISFDSDLLTLDHDHGSIDFSTGASYDVGVALTKAGQDGVTAAVAAAMKQCVTTPRADSTCPLPSSLVVPGTLHGHLTSDVARAAHLAITGDAAGVVAVTGSADVDATYDRLSRENLPVAQAGKVTLPLTAWMYLTEPISVVWGRSRDASAAGSATTETIHAAPGPPEAPEYWFDQWHIEDLWAGGARGAGVTIAELDTGVNADLDGLHGKVLAGKDFGSLGGDGRIDRDVDDFGHGTAMASIMVTSPSTFGITGIAPNAKILPVALPIASTTDVSDKDYVAAAIRWAVDHGAKIINMSVGSSRAGTQASCPQADQSAVNYALSKGAILIAAGGNGGNTGNPIEAPAACLGVVAVGAIGQDGTVADFSSRRRYLSFVAPGENVPSLGRVAGTGFTGDGSSQATAITSAVAALVWSKHPTLTARQVEARLFATLTRRSSEPSADYGYGVLDANRAVLADVPKDAPDPVYARVQPFLQRAAALAAAKPTPPTAAGHADASFGTVHIEQHSAGRITTKVVLGGVLALIGLCGLAAVMLLALNSQASSGSPVERADDAAQ
ncbi:MAG TPA: S8 family serine peptidase [Jatrophihabitans sp.]